MADSPLPESFIGLLARHLAKLCEQLRQLLACPGENTPDAGRRFGIVNRLRAATAALAVGGEEAGPLAGLVPDLEVFVGILAADPLRLPSHLEGPTDRLAAALEEALAELDDGVAPGRVAADPAWEAVLGSFLNAGTLLEDLDSVEEILTAWSRRHGDTDLSRSQEQALRSRWTLLRDYGDTLFGDPAEGPRPLPRPAGDAGPARELEGVVVMLLVDSPFRRDQLAERLRAAGGLVEAADDPEHVLRRVGDPEPPEIILCDNLEPSRHLATLRSRLGGLAAADRPPLVLVTGSDDAADRLRERAKHLGASGAWAAPWAIAELRSRLES